MSDAADTLVLSRPQTRRRRTRAWSARTLAPVGVAIALIVLWALTIRVADIAPTTFPNPAEVATAMFERADDLFPATWITLQTMVVGFAIAAASGLVIALVIVLFRPVELTIYPLLVGSQVIPKIAIAPVIFIWFGLGSTSRIIVVVVLSFFPIVIAAVAGLRSLDRNAIHLARSVGASRWQLLVHFQLPQALPQIFSGLKLAATRAAGAAIVAEYITPGEGLGRTIFLATSQLRPDIAMAGVAYLAVIGVGFYFLVAAAERLAVPWHVSVRSRSGA